jgi:predicted  nucleic acid-binding Zn-ribbon protein
VEQAKEIADLKKTIEEQKKRIEEVQATLEAKEKEKGELELKLTEQEEKMIQVGNQSNTIKFRFQVRLLM